jgi:hypothetical protein
MRTLTAIIILHNNTYVFVFCLLWLLPCVHLASTHSFPGIVFLYCAHGKKVCLHRPNDFIPTHAPLLLIIIINIIACVQLVSFPAPSLQCFFSPFSLLTLPHFHSLHWHSCSSFPIGPRVDDEDGHDGNGICTLFSFISTFPYSSLGPPTVPCPTAQCKPSTYLMVVPHLELPKVTLVIYYSHLSPLTKVLWKTRGVAQFTKKNKKQKRESENEIL